MGSLGLFIDYKVSSRILALESIQPLREMSTRDISWGKDGECLGLTILPHSFPYFLEILGDSASSSCGPKVLSRSVKGKIYILPFTLKLCCVLVVCKMKYFEDQKHIHSFIQYSV